MATNYITQLNSTFQRFANDKNITPFHISLYMALFQKWNGYKFQNPIVISREEIMYISKIGSANTYTKCLKDLHKWAYIKYEPSHNYHVGSKVYMYTFNKTTDKTSNKSSDKTANKTSDKRTVREVRPYNKHIQTIKNKLNNTKEYEHTREKNNRKFIVADSNQRTTPTLEEIKNFFAERGSTELEAKKFFNYYQSNGWLVGKVPMKNWNASAEKWILNGDSFKQKPSTNKLHTTTNKNYNEPL